MPDNAYINTRTPMVDQKGMIAQVWYRFIDKIREKANIIDGTSSNSAIAGTAAALPATPEGYMTIILDGTEYKVPYYK